MRTRCVSGLFGTLACLAATATAAAAEGQRSPVVVHVSTEPLIRTAAVVSATSQVIHALTEGALDHWIPRIRAEDTAGVSLRLAQVYLVSLPIASLSQAVSHELGHKHYIARSGEHAYDFKITDWPWPIPLTGASVSTTDLPTLRIISAGAEVDFVHHQLVSDRIYRNGTGDVYAWAEFGQAKVRIVTYVMSDLSDSRLRDERAFYRDTNLGDPRRFALEFEKARQGVRLPSIGSIRARAADIRSGALLSLVDLTLVSSVVRTIQYIASGERITKPFLIRAGSLGFAPSIDFLLTENGYEHRLSTRVAGQSNQWLGYVRRLTTPLDAHLIGVGLAWRSQTSSTLSLVARLDAWRETKIAAGARIELGANRRVRWLGQNLEAGATIAYKSRGVLPGHETGSGISVSISLQGRF